MSSLVRRIQKRIARSQGFYRSKAEVYYERDHKGDVVRSLGYILNTDAERVGLHWPQVAAPTSKFELERRATAILRRLDRHGVKA